MTSILLIRPSALGDVCRTVPVLASLRCAYPGARVDWLVRDSFVDAVKAHPALSNCIPLPRDEFSRQLKGLRTGHFRRWLRELASQRYDIALDCQGLFRSGFFTWASRARRRVGLANARELGWIWLNEKHRVPWSGHSVDRMLELVRLAGIEPVRDMRLYSSEVDRAWVAADPDLMGCSFAVIAPTSHWPGKRWPAERFARVIRWMLESARGPAIDKVVLVGTPSERSEVGSLLDLARANPRVVDRVGATSVGQLMALVEASSFILANDSAAIHMAVGFDRPAIGLYGATRIEEDGPFSGHSPARPVVVLQHADAAHRVNHKRAGAHAASFMDRISVDEVQAAISALLSSSCLRASVPSCLPTRSS